MRALAVACVLILASCVAGTAPTTVPTLGCDGRPIEPGTTVTCEVPRWPERLVDVHVPAGYNGGGRWPVIVAFHGGGGTRVAAARTTCPGGDLDDPDCLDALGDREGFFTVRPDGTAAGGLGRLRTWNAGGSGDLDCVAGAACERSVDDVAYVAALLDLLAAHYPIEARVVVTGLSNGGAMAHRLGCELADRVRVVAAVAGTNQLQGCIPSMAISVLHIHGSDDPRWPFAGGRLSDLADNARVTGAMETAEGWARALGCSGPVDSAIPDTADDGMTSTRIDWSCPRGVVSLVAVAGGGHTWPRGYQYSPPRLVGDITQDFSANELIWEFARSAP